MIDWESRYANNMKNFDGYAIGKTLAYLSDPQIISLAGGLPSPDVFQASAFRAVSEKILLDDIDKIMQYSAIPGEQTLFDAVIHFLKRDNIHLEKQNILITSSGQHGLDITGRAFLDRGDIVLMDRPTFAGALVAFAMENPRFVGVDIEPDGTNTDALEKVIQQLLKTNETPKFIYVVPDFQNPTGITMGLEKRKKLLEISYGYNIPIIEDSPYRELRYYGKTMPSLFSLDQKMYGGGGNVIGVYTFSKMFCPGLRVGFNIGCPEVIAKMTNIKEGNILNTPKYNQDMCAAFLTEMDLDVHFENCRAHYKEKLEMFLETMETYFPKESGVTWTTPDGGLFLWVSVADHIDTDKLFLEAIKHQVAFVPGEQFYGENPARNHLRINFSFSTREQLVEAVKRLSNCISSVN
jgi:2-aminoadipate transaminase